MDRIKQQRLNPKITTNMNQNDQKESFQQSRHQYQDNEHLFQTKLPFTIHPKVSFAATTFYDPSKSKLQMYKEHLLNIRLRKQTIPKVPQPSVIECFSLMKKQKYIVSRKEKLLKQIQQKKLQYQKLKKVIDRYREAYDSKQQAIKEKTLLSKILSSKLQNQFQKTRLKFKQLDFSKTINISVKKMYFYQLAEVFYNNEARNIFSPQSEIKTDQEMGICLGYLAFLIHHVAIISGVQSWEKWIKFKFKGSKSTMTIYDQKLLESSQQQLNNTSSSSNRQLSQTFLLHPKEPRLNQALMSLSEQLKQIMKHNLGITNIGSSNNKTSNFYQLCEQLSKFLLNV